MLGRLHQRPPEMKVKVISAPSASAPDAPCSDLQGLLSGLLPDAQISASSSRDMVWSPGTARLVASRSGWFPAPAQPLAGEEWLQVRKAFNCIYYAPTTKHYINASLIVAERIFSYMLKMQNMNEI